MPTFIFSSFDSLVEVRTLISGSITREKEKEGEMKVIKLFVASISICIFAGTPSTSAFRANFTNKTLTSQRKRAKRAKRGSEESEERGKGGKRKEGKQGKEGKEIRKEREEREKRRKGERR